MLKIRDLSLKLNNKVVLDKVNVSFEKNKITAIIGKNASGKTSLIKCINGIYKYNGDILLNSKNIKDIDIKDLSKQLSILPQLLKYPHILVKDIIAMGRNPYLSLKAKLTDNDLYIIDQVISKLNIVNLKEKYLDELSGGQRQLVYLALQLTQDAPLMIFDEPSSFMDVNYEHFFLDILKEQKENYNKTIVLVMHNINQAIRYSDNIVVVDKGKIIFSGTKLDCLKQEVIEKTFNLKKYEIDDIMIFNT